MLKRITDIFLRGLVTLLPIVGQVENKRNPKAKWKLSVDFIERVKELQQHILADYSTMVKPRGLMVYSTCSLLPSENEKQVEKFLESRKEQFELVEQKWIKPSEGFDGFYMALLKRKA